MDAGLTCAVAAQLRNLGLTLSSARPSGYLAARLWPCSDGHSAVFCLSAAETKVWVALEGVADCCSWPFWASRGTASKANTLSPLITVVVSVCHSYRLVSCITCLSYKKDVQQRGLRVKSSVNGTKGAKHTASKTSLYASDERTPVGRAATMGCKLCRSSQKWRRSFCSSAIGRATSGAAVPRPYLKATE